SVLCGMCICCFFFFQAEDGIRDSSVTGVQTCALPISGLPSWLAPSAAAGPQPTESGGGRVTGFQLMIPPFVACMVLVAMLSYLGLHVIAREVIFVDLSLAQMAALGGLSALLLHVEAA